MSPDLAVALGLVLPLAGAAGVLATGRWPNVREGVTIATTLLTFGSVASLMPVVMEGGRPGFEVLEVLPGLVLAFEVEPLGILFAALASGLWIPTALYAIGYMRGHGEENQTRFYTCFALAIAFAIGVAFSRNLFTLFLFYELLTLSTYPLVTHHGDAEARRAGRTYLGILLTTSVAFLLLGIIWTYDLTGTLEFARGGILAGFADPWTLTALLALYAFGIGKAAIMPFHRWLPAAMVAPTPVSALLHAVAIVKAGVFAVLKVAVYVFGIDLLRETGASVWLAYAAGATILIASGVAIGKKNLKARLAYSTISQLSYIVLGAALATSAGIVGGGLHIALHAFGKITLFFCAGAIYVTAHKTEVDELDGIGRAMPFTMLAFLLGSVSIIGAPLGVWGKWFLSVGAVDEGQLVLVFVLTASSLLSVAYLMPIVGRAFFLPARGEAPGGAEEGEAGGLREAPLMCLVPLCATALGCVALFFLAPRIRELLLPVAGLQ